MRNDNYGLALFDRVVIMMFTLIIAGGLAFFFGGVQGSAVIGMLVMAFFVTTGFIPFWIAGISIIMLFIYMGADNR
jgi:hypothetical protein